MWLVRTLAATDPDEFATSVRPPSLKILVSERGRFDASATLIDFGKVRALRAAERLARTMHIESSRSGVVFQTEPGPDIFWNGALMHYNQVAFCKAGTSNIFRSTGPSHYAAMTLDAADMEAMAESVARRGYAPAPGPAIVSPGTDVMAHLRAMHAAAGRSADSLRDLANPVGRAEAIERVLIESLRNIIMTASPRRDTMGRQHHELVARRFLEALELDSVSPPRMDEISEAIGVSGRTLRLACQEQLGVSPTQYLLLRRMRLAHRALQQADPHATTVTDIATILGFWELGRFSVRYREIFGESPSSTLKGPCGSSRSLMLSD
jgi:AraC-like DNA-binding protein